MGMVHHATIIRSPRPCEYCPAVDESLDTQLIVLDQFGINDARTLIDTAYQRPQTHSVQLLIVQTNFITHEAQNALLKVLEEPPQSTNFLFVLPPDLSLLPTLTSRFARQTVAVITQATNDTFDSFLSASYAERLQAIEQATKQKNIEWQREIKQGLITYITTGRSTQASVLRDIEYVVRLLLARGASNKMLLEHAALTLPVS